MSEKLREIRSWEEWIGIWERNRFKEVALGLLHCGFSIPTPKKEGATWCEARCLELVVRARFYLATAEWASPASPSSEHAKEIGRKAAEMLIGIFLPELLNFWRLKRLKEDSIFQEIVSYLGQGGLPTTQPYQRTLEENLSQLWRIREDLKIKDEALLQALTRIKMFDFIITNKLVGAIPFIKELLYEAFQFNKTGASPEEDREAFFAALDLLDSATMQKAMLQYTRAASALYRLQIINNQR